MIAIFGDQVKYDPFRLNIVYLPARKNPGKEVNRGSSLSRVKDRFSSIWNRSGDSIKAGTLVYAITRIWLTLVSVFIFFKVPISPSEFRDGYYDVTPLLTGWRGVFLGMWQRWDTVHYQAIAQWGYSQDYLTAFFPGYPFLGRVVSSLLQVSRLAGLLLVSNTFAWLSLILLHHIVKSMCDQDTAKLTLIFLITFPSSFFLFAGYPHSMVLFLVLFSYWQAKQGRWMWAALAGLAAGLTHGTVLPLALMLAWQAFQALRHTRFSLSWAIVFVPLLPLGGIALFLSWRTSQEFEAYSSLLSNRWSRIYQFPWDAMINAIKQLVNSREIITFINILVALLLLFAAIWSLKRLPIELKIYSITHLIFLFSTGTTLNSLESLNRYALGMFPAFIFLAMVTTQNKKLRLAIIEFNMLFYLHFCYLFLTWHWVG